MVESAGDTRPPDTEDNRCFESSKTRNAGDESWHGEAALVAEKTFVSDAAWTNRAEKQLEHSVYVSFLLMQNPCLRKRFDCIFIS